MEDTKQSQNLLHAPKLKNLNLSLPRENPGYGLITGEDVNYNNLSSKDTFLSVNKDLLDMNYNIFEEDSYSYNLSAFNDDEFEDSDSSDEYVLTNNFITNSASLVNNNDNINIVNNNLTASNESNPIFKMLDFCMNDSDKFNNKWRNLVEQKSKIIFNQNRFEYFYNNNNNNIEYDRNNTIIENLIIINNNISDYEDSYNYDSNHIKNDLKLNKIRHR